MVPLPLGRVAISEESTVALQPLGRSLRLKNGFVAVFAESPMTRGLGDSCLWLPRAPYFARGGGRGSWFSDTR